MKTVDEVLVIADSMGLKRSYLVVDYSEKDQIKRAGAKWDTENRKWYIDNFDGIEDFNMFGRENAHADLAFYIQNFLDFNHIHPSKFHHLLEASLTPEELSSFYKNVVELKAMNRACRTWRGIIEQVLRVARGEGEPKESASSKAANWLSERDFDSTFTLLKSGMQFRLVSREGKMFRVVMHEGATRVQVLNPETFPVFHDKAKAGVTEGAVQEIVNPAGVKADNEL